MAHLCQACTNGVRWDEPRYLRRIHLPEQAETGAVNVLAAAGNELAGACAEPFLTPIDPVPIIRAHAHTLPRVHRDDCRCRRPADARRLTSGRSPRSDL